MRRPRTAYAALVVASALFGSTFVIVKDAVEAYPPASFIGWRFLGGALLLVALRPPRGAAIWRDGCLAGLFLFAGYALQTEGLVHTSAANSGLITGLYVVITPFVAALVARTRIDLGVVAGCGVAFAGLALLTIGDGFDPAAGDLLTLGCAVAFAAHIVTLARVAPRHPVIALTAVQLVVTAAAALGLAVATGDLAPPGRDVLGAILFTGVFVSAGAYLLQTLAQTIVGPAGTAVVLTLEPAFAVAAATVFAGEDLTARGWAGTVLILAGIVVVVTLQPDELPEAEAVTPAH